MPEELEEKVETWYHKDLREAFSDVPKRGSMFRSQEEKDFEGTVYTPLRRSPIETPL